MWSATNARSPIYLARPSKFVSNLDMRFSISLIAHAASSLGAKRRFPLEFA
jgi:hypothetical protein